MKSALLKILPPIWLVLFLLVGFGMHYAFPEMRVFDISGSMTASILSTVAVIVGAGLTLHSSRLFAIEKNEILPNSPTNRVLITRGAYRFSRNPMYLGMIFTLIGVALWIGTFPFVLATIGHFLVLNFVFIPFEEAKLTRIFGTAYEGYKRRVRRWL